jgi:hypothetical protein
MDHSSNGGRRTGGEGGGPSQVTRGGVTLWMALISRYKPSMEATMARSCTLEAARTRDVLRDASSPPTVGQPPPWGQRSNIFHRPKLGFVCVVCVEWGLGAADRSGRGERGGVGAGLSSTRARRSRPESAGDEGGSKQIKRRRIGQPRGNRRQWCGGSPGDFAKIPFQFWAQTFRSA